MRRWPMRWKNTRGSWKASPDREGTSPTELTSNRVQGKLPHPWRVTTPAPNLKPVVACYGCGSRPRRRWLRPRHLIACKASSYTRRNIETAARPRSSPGRQEIHDVTAFFVSFVSCFDFSFFRFAPLRLRESGLDAFTLEVLCASASS